MSIFKLPYVTSNFQNLIHVNFQVASDFLKLIYVNFQIAICHLQFSKVHSCQCQFSKVQINLILLSSVWVFSYLGAFFQKSKVNNIYISRTTVLWQNDNQVFQTCREISTCPFPTTPIWNHPCRHGLTICIFHICIFHNCIFVICIFVICIFVICIFVYLYISYLYIWYILYFFPDLFPWILSPSPSSRTDFIFLSQFFHISFIS